MTGKKFPPASRMKKRRDYQAAQKNGVRYRGKNLTIICHNSTNSEPRLGIAVSKKTGKAVQRNRAKRLLREYFRTHREKFAGRGDVVIIWKTKIGYPGMNEVAAELEDLLETPEIEDKK